MTKTASLGRWVPVHDEEWNDGLPLETKYTSLDNGETANGVEEGEVVFEKDVLPWTPGLYEVSYLLLSA